MREEIRLLWDLKFHLLPVKDAVKEEKNEMVSTSDHDEDDSLSHHNSCSSDGVVVGNSSRRKSKRPRRLEHYKSLQVTFKRVMKKDVRKIFPLMFCNTLNGNDFKSFERLVSRFMTPKCKIIAYPLPQLDRPYRRYEGPEQLALNVQSMVAFLPDYVLIPRGSRIIRQLLDKDISIVELYVNMKATKLVYYDNTTDNNESLISSNKECPSIFIQPSKVLIDFDIMITFCFNKDGFVVKNISSLTTSIPSFNSV